MNIIYPKNYEPKLTVRETQEAISKKAEEISQCLIDVNLLKGRDEHVTTWMTGELEEIKQTLMAVKTKEKMVFGYIVSMLCRMKMELMYGLQMQKIV